MMEHWDMEGIYRVYSVDRTGFIDVFFPEDPCAAKPYAVIYSNVPVFIEPKLLEEREAILERPANK